MKLKIEYIDSEESFGMSGPWIGKLKVNDIELKHEFLDGNYVRTKDEKIVAFNCFIPGKKEKILFGIFNSYRQKRRFKILVFKIEENRWYLSNDYWKSLYLTRMTTDKVFYTKAFHDGDREMFPEQVIELGQGNFTEIDEKEIRKTPHNTMYN